MLQIKQTQLVNNGPASQPMAEKGFQFPPEKTANHTLHARFVMMASCPSVSLDPAGMPG